MHTNNETMIKNDYQPGVTTFKVERDQRGRWVARSYRDGKVIDEKYALSEEDAKINRTALINEFWGFKVN